MNLSLEGRNALVCGGSQGIGYAIAEELALMGANCILLARTEDNLRIAASQLDTSLRQTHSYHAVDFNNPVEVKELIRKITGTQWYYIAKLVCVMYSHVQCLNAAHGKPCKCPVFSFV